MPPRVGFRGGSHEGDVLQPAMLQEHLGQVGMVTDHFFEQVQFRLELEDVAGSPLLVRIFARGIEPFLANGEELLLEVAYRGETHGEIYLHLGGVGVLIHDCSERLSSSAKAWAGVLCRGGLTLYAMADELHSSFDELKIAYSKTAGLSSLIGCATIQIRQNSRAAMNALHALEYLAKHTAFKTVTGIAQAAGVDTSNFHACLARKRPWPKSMVSRVACALGLQVVQLEPDVNLEIAPQSVIHVAVPGEELPQLAEVLDTAAKGVKSWLMRVPVETPPAGAVQAMAMARVLTSYLVLHITWGSTDSAVDGIDQLPKVLPGVWLESNPDVGAVSLTSPEWIRLRSGLESINALDRRFGVQQAPRGEEWAHMLLDVSKLGLSPAELTKLAALYAQQT